MQAYRKDFPGPEFNGQFDGFGWLTAGKLTDHTGARSLSLPKGLPRAFVNFAYAEFHSWLLISMDS